MSNRLSILSSRSILVDAVLSGRDGALLEVDEVVAALLGALRAGLKSRHEARELVVEVLRFRRLAADDERRARLVDEDVVHLVHDREVAIALHALIELGDHVVAQVVEAELVVRPVGHVRGVRLGAGNRAQVQQPLVRAAVVRVEDERRFVLDDADRQPEAVVNGSHPLRVALGQVVVDRDDVHAPTGHRVECRSEGRDEGLALARLHL